MTKSAHQIMGILKRPRLWVALIAVVIVVGTAGTYAFTQYQRQQTAAKLGWTPDPSSDPGDDSSLKPSLVDHSPLEDDVQLSGTPVPSPAAAPGTPSIDVKINDDLMTDLMVFTTPGESSKVVWIKMTASNLNLADCSLTDEITLDDAQFTHQTNQLSAKAYQEISLVDGLHKMTASCSGGKVVSPVRSVRIADRQPKICKGFAYEQGEATAGSLEELKNGIVGTWQGCVTTPWVPPYFVTMTFNADGTYEAVSDEIIDGQAMNAMYYGREDAHPQKKYALDSFQNSLGVGTLDIAFAVSNTTTQSPLTQVKLAGNKLSFEFMHRAKYGPLKFELKR